MLKLISLVPFFPKKQKTQHCRKLKNYITFQLDTAALGQTVRVSKELRKQ